MEMYISLSLKCLWNRRIAHIMKNKLFLLLCFVIIAYTSDAQTATSLFWRSDSLQVSEIVSEIGDLYRKVGHHGPAIENSHMALRLYFNDSGAIDLYSKSGRGMELENHLWYPSVQLQEKGAAGRDAYIVGKTVGFGGIALWDGEKEVKLVATKGRTARVGNTKKGSYLEMIAYGVPYKDEFVDIMIRIDVTAKSREAKVTASELSGKKVSFLTGINFHENQTVRCEKNYVSVWGLHPAKEASLPIGAGMFYSDKTFPTVEKTENMVRLISEPASKVSTTLMAASTLEAEVNNLKRFDAYMAK